MHSELIARLEAATGPDRELDAAIWRLTDPQRYSIWECGQRALLNRDWDEPRRQITLQARAKIAAPRFTASIDAALTLVPPDWHLSLNGVNDSWHATINDTRFGKWGLERGFAATPALAIVIAALRAIEARQ